MSSADGSDFDASRIQSVSMTIRLLRELASASEPLGVSELARRVGESKARIHRHLLTLRQEGLLSQESAGERYRLGWVLFELGQAAAAQFDIAEIAAPALRALRSATGLTVLLGQRAGDEIIMSHTYDSENMIAVTARRGLRVPAHGSAAGRVMLAFASAEDRKRILGKPLRKLTPHTLTNKAEIAARLDAITQRGYDYAANESQFGINSIAAGVFERPGELAAVISIIGTQTQVTVPPDGKLLQQVLACARAVSGSLTSRAHAPQPAGGQRAPRRRPAPG
ncbi:MAG: Transcriptional regulator, IclR family [uncultured Ramlibacter sp.]|uniref:Transcriptional regulator, IclR family n=1 Tax=uncultured Ramlibacter sp. TaxID=260755 RepID=A0A6J4QHU0_9BURK|nr:MAG: Transcriptional regulator, IclR family [uncultured Ramlibacter sp.]